MDKYKIREKLNEYCEFDTTELFDTTDFFVVFGGAIRDIIAGVDVNSIHDIDILCLSESKLKAMVILVSNGYTRMDLVNPLVFEMYKDIRCIFHPLIYMKGLKQIQLITPSRSGVFRLHTNDDCTEFFNRLSEPFFELLKNVDISTSGVFYDGEYLYESVTNSISHCLRKEYIILDGSLMYNKERIHARTTKLYMNGWRSVDMCNLIKLRVEKINKLRSTTLKIDDFRKKLFENFEY